MKKSICLLITIFALSFSFYAKDKKFEIKPINPGPEYSDEEVDAGWKESGKNALEATGKFFKDVGESIGDTVTEANEIKCYGTWVYKSENVTTTFICNKDGTMEIRKRSNLETEYWKGTFSNSLNALSFDISETGKKSSVAKATKKDVKTTWIIRYRMGEDGNTVKLYSSYIPTDADKTDFTKGVVFTKK